MAQDPARPSSQLRGIVVSGAVTFRVPSSVLGPGENRLGAELDVDLVPPKHLTIAVVPGSSPGRRLISTQLGQYPFRS
jgi:hypothetical protein